jgi:Asp-tRNA(Asn)/Glu-tRNA(Gln) amidotransferase A subunit family amidase
MFQFDVNNYLASLGEKAPFKSIKEIYDAGLYSPYVKKRLEAAIGKTLPPDKRQPPCHDVYHDQRNISLRRAVLAAMAQDNLDVFIFPTWSNPPRKVNDMESPAGDNSQILSPHTGFPAITVPMGWTSNGLPAGLQIVGKTFAEPVIIKIAYAYEQATRHRRPAEKFPPLKD